MPENLKRENKLSEEEISRASLALEALLLQKHQPVKSLDQVEKIYEKRTIADRVESLKYEIQDSSVKILYLAEVLAGNNTSDLTFLREILNNIKQLPKELKPDVIIASGLLQGNFKFRNKDRRSNLVLSLDQQFASAKFILKELEGLGIEIIYSISSEDKEICRDGTIETMRSLQHAAKPLLKDKQKAHVSYWQEDQLKQNPAWDKHLKFQTDVVFEYCLRSGRRLRSADEVKNLTKGKLVMEEYLILYDAFQRLAKSQEIPESYKNVLELNNIPLVNKDLGGFEVVDDVNLTLKTKEHEFTQKIKHNFKLGTTSLAQYPTDAAEAVTNQLAAEGIKPPKAFVTMHQQQVFGVGDPEGNWVLSTGSFLDPTKALEQKGSVASAGLPQAWRSLTARKIINLPTATMHEFTDDSRHIITFYNKKLLDKSDSAPRTTILTITDWQTGSSAARPDLQAKLLDLAFSEVLPNRPMWILSTGDIYHGQNYASLSMENFRTGLIRIEDQQRYVEWLIEKSVEHIPAADFSNIDGISIVPGNHEWNSGYARTGAIFNNSLVNLFRYLYLLKGDSNGKERIKASELIDTPFGDVTVAWISLDQIAGYGVLSQHMMLERGAKGRGKVPIYHAQRFIEGAGSLAEKIDITNSGHWHHNQYALFGNKLHIISPALEGLTNFELTRGLRPTPGGSLIHLGGGLPPQVEFLSLETLAKYQVKDGYFSDQNLKREGFSDDEHFDPISDGFFSRKSALQKALWSEIEGMTRKIHSHL